MGRDRDGRTALSLLAYIPQMRYNYSVLKDYLKKNNISIYRLSKESGVPYSTLNDLVNHKITIDNFKVGPARRIAAALKITFEDFFDISSDEGSEIIVSDGVRGELEIKGRNYYVNYLLDGKMQSEKLCKLNQTNDAFAETYARWTMEDAVTEAKLEDSTL